MNVYTVNDIFSKKELISLKNCFDFSKEKIEDPELGRIKINHFDLSNEIKTKLVNIVNSIHNESFQFAGVSAAEYRAKYGTPNLPVHYDRDSIDLIFNFQLHSNTSWDIGVDCTVYSLKDNSAAIFHPNLSAHWRPHKTFKSDEFVKMIFFRFRKINSVTDYSYLQGNALDESFKEINEFRNSL